MEAQGFVSTKRDLQRKNWVRVSLTKKGEEAVKLWATSTEVPDVFSCYSKNPEMSKRNGEYRRAGYLIGGKNQGQSRVGILETGCGLGHRPRQIHKCPK
jgi:DNA-binding PadR family transcriptional regulator